MKGLFFEFFLSLIYLKESPWPIGAGCSSCVALLVRATLFWSAAQTPEREAPTSRLRIASLAAG